MTINKINVNGQEYDLDILVDGSSITTALGNTATVALAGYRGKVFAGTTSTAADTAAKAVTIDDTLWQLQAGDLMLLTSTNTNSAANATFAINSGDAKSVKYAGSAIAAPYLDKAGSASAPQLYIYDGTSWNWLSGTSIVASRLSNTAKVGNTNKPVYFDANGVPQAISYTIAKSVPSDAKFTDTTYSAGTTSLLTTGTDTTNRVWPAKQIADYVTGLGYTTNTGTVTQVKVGSTAYNPSSGVVSIPAYPTSLPASDVYSWAKASSKPSYKKSEVGLGNVTNDAQVKRTEMGAASGVATLGTDGKVPSSQLPSYVDDVLEYADQASFPSTGESGKIYIAKDTNKTYRWSGSAYTEISASIVVGTTTGTAFDGKSGYDHINNTSNPHSVTKAQVGLGNVENKSSATIRGELTKDDVTTALGYTPPTTNTTYSNATTSVAGLMSSNDKTKLNGIASGATAVTESTVAGWGFTKNTGTLTSHQAVSSDNNTAAWGSAVTVGTVGGTALKFTMPANPNTNTWTAASTSAAGYVPAATKGKFLHCNSSTGKLEWVNDNNTTYSAATTSAAGLMSAADKTKLNKITMTVSEGILTLNTATL